MNQLNQSQVPYQLNAIIIHQNNLFRFKKNVHKNSCRFSFVIHDCKKRTNGERKTKSYMSKCLDKFLFVMLIFSSLSDARSLSLSLSPYVIFFVFNAFSVAVFCLYWINEMFIVLNFIGFYFIFHFILSNVLWFHCTVCWFYFVFISHLVFVVFFLFGLRHLFCHKPSFQIGHEEFATENT